jgi:tetratricopeptide (TPR) repeat protein
MILTLQLRHDPAAQQATDDAWFINGNDPARWLDELARTGLAQTETRLFIISRPANLPELWANEHRGPPRPGPLPKESEQISGESSNAFLPQGEGRGEGEGTAHQPNVHGLLAVPGSGSTASPSPAAIPCRLLAGRLFIPADAILEPPVSEAEIRELCPWPLAFLHPTLGLSHFENDDALRVWDLIDTPLERTAQWNFARHGQPALPPLTAIILARPPTIDDIFGSAPEEIGTEPLDDLPPADGELRDDAISKSLRDVKKFIAKGLTRALSGGTQSGRGGKWLKSVETWANRQLGQVSEQLQKLRNKELHRLLSLLDKDPEAGLRHAIPMSNFPHRGVTPPGARLGQRSPDFDARRLGGRPADFWAIPYDLQEVLRRRYREMADREMQLGRFRRAAYIYAELLGDLVSAAHALKRGKFFREAALIYEEQLHNPLEAARCLAEGGLLLEAIERYEKHARWLEAAELYERLGDHAAAASAIRRVVNECLAQDDILGAAKLVEERLRLPDEAIDLLRNAWPSSRQAAACTGTLFQILARTGQHEIATEHLGMIGLAPVPNAQVLPLLTALGGPARDYPDAQVRHCASDFSRVLISHQLKRPDLGSDNADRLMERLVRLAPEDRLLARDGNRHLADRRNAERLARTLAPPPPAGKKPVIIRKFDLPRQIEWAQLRSEWHWFFTVGFTRKRMTVLRGIWEGEFQSLTWDWNHTLSLFEPTAERGKTLAISMLTTVPVPRKSFPASDALFNQECCVGTPTWIPSGLNICTAFEADAVWTLNVDQNGRLILSCHDKSGNLQRTLDITDPLHEGRDPNGGNGRWQMAALAQGVAVTTDNRLVVTQPDGKLVSLTLPHQAERLYPTLPHTRQGVAVMLKHGAVMHWRGTQELIELDRDIESPQAAFVPGGPLVLVSGSQGILLEVDTRGVHGVTRFELTSKNPIGVCSTSNPGQFAVLDTKGEMVVYQVPR